MQAQHSSIQRFIDSQETHYSIALKEIRNGRKTSHWIWYVFPQLKGLGRSQTSEYYGIQNLDEAREYLNNELLRSRLIEISQALLACDGDIQLILGIPDNLKVRSCMTLFRAVDPSITVFQEVLDKFYQGKPDYRTLSIIASQQNQ